MKDVARDQNQIGLQLDDLVDHPLQCERYVGFTLIDSRRRLPLILTEAEVDVGDVDQPHRPRIARIH
jgi:hypothetical protein